MRNRVTHDYLYTDKDIIARSMPTFRRSGRSWNGFATAFSATADPVGGARRQWCGVEVDDEP